ncbi:MAG TPA: undecaprenyldiphospho-muramoylpentapeptide beta-N-acetylglucosaminyltransferase [Chitinophagaceae bacterium]
MSKKVIIAGGGTGGHIFPAIAIANALKKADPSIELLFVGAKGKMEMEKIPQAGYKIEGIDIAGFNRSSLLKNIGLPFKLVKSYFQVRRIVADFMPDAVVGVGGYSTYPVVRYAQSKGIPSFIHEIDSFAGKANSMLAKRATKIFAASTGMENFFPESKLVYTGNPVRANITNSKVTREEGIRFFGLNPALKTVLVTGGSLGAKGINEAIDAHLEEFGANNLQLVWQTGKPYAERAKERAAGKQNVWVNDFIPQMEYAYAAGDIIISRAGGTVYELCVVKKPVILVPFPFATKDHQTVNAMNLVKKNAGLMVKDSEAKEKLVSLVIALSKNEQQQKELINNISKLGISDADTRIAVEILKTIS